MKRPLEPSAIDARIAERIVALKASAALARRRANHRALAHGPGRVQCKLYAILRREALSVAEVQKRLLLTDSNRTVAVIAGLAALGLIARDGDAWRANAETRA